MFVELEQDLYFIPDNYKDITLQKWCDIQKFIAENVVKDDIEEREQLEFYINYVALFDIPKDVLVKCKLTAVKEDELGIINLFNHLWQFKDLPEFKGKHESFRMNGIKYVYNEIKLAKPMQNWTFLEYEESQAVLQSLAKIKENKYDMLSLLCAIYYRPTKWKFFGSKIEPYNEKSVNKRAELFMGLNMQQVSSCYFFLLKRMLLSTRDIANSLTEKEKKVS